MSRNYVNVDVDDDLTAATSCVINAWPWTTIRSTEYRKNAVPQLATRRADFAAE